MKEGVLNMLDNMQLAKKIIQKAREIFAKDYAYIVETPAEVVFTEVDDDLHLVGISFVAEGGYQDEIAISEYAGPVLTLEEDVFETLANCEGFEQFLALEPNNLVKLPEFIKERVTVANEMK